MMREITPREVQLGELGVLKKIAEICEKENLRYFLFYGTLIGAVRHKGFIPWDDDVDIVMPRPDYEKLLSYVEAHAKELEPFKMMNYRYNKDYIYPISRFCDTRYKVEYQGTAEYGLGLFVDIYPFDGSGNTPEEAKAIMAENQRLVKCVFQAGMQKFEKSNTALWRTPIKFAMYCYAKLRGAYSFIKQIEKRAMKHSFQEDTYCNCNIWDYVSYFFRRDMFDDFTYMDFEDEKFRVPVNYDEILRLCYGDYMQLPPEEERVGHHYYTAYLKDGENE